MSNERTVVLLESPFEPLLVGQGQLEGARVLHGLTRNQLKLRTLLKQLLRYVHIFICLLLPAIVRRTVLLGDSLRLELLLGLVPGVRLLLEEVEQTLVGPQVLLVLHPGHDWNMVAHALQTGVFLEDELVGFGLRRLVLFESHGVHLARGNPDCLLRFHPLAQERDVRVVLEEGTVFVGVRVVQVN